MFTFSISQHLEKNCNLAKKSRMPNCAKTFDFDVAKMPEPSFQQSVGIDCCEEYTALASTTTAAIEYNDEFLAIGKKASVSDNFNFIIKKCGDTTTLPNRGTTVIFPQDDLAVGFIYKWREYLANEGAGMYVIYESFTFLGASVERIYAKIGVWSFTDERARNTFRIHSVFSNESKVNNSVIDFTGSNAYSMLRLGGKFGEWKAQTITNTLVDRAYKANINSASNQNKYLMTLDPITFIFTDRLINLHLLCGTEHFVTDHNKNHRKYTQKHVEYVSESLNQEEPAIEQILKLEFTDFTKDSLSRFNKR